MSVEGSLFTIKGSISLSSVIRQTHPLKPAGVSEFVGLCPFHDERTPSFHVYDQTGSYHCFGCKSGGDVFDWLKNKRGMSNVEANEFLGGAITSVSPITIAPPKQTPLMPVPTNAAACIFPYGQPDVLHRYCDANNRLMFIIGRYEATTDKKKRFTPAHYGQDETWHFKGMMSDNNRSIYGLEKLNKHNGIRIIVAGEKKCDQLQAILTDNAILSWSGGDSAFDKTEWSPIKNDVVIYWADNDETSHAIGHKLAKLCKKLYVVQIPPETPPKWDCGDAIDAGWGTEQIMCFISNKVLYELPEVVIPIKAQKDNRIDELLKNIPGITGKIAAWINSTAKYPFPGLEFAASAVAVGVAMGHKYCSETDVRTNLYITGFAGASSGKDHARKCISRLFDAVGESSLEIGVPKSGSGLRSSISKTSKGMILWDEIGLRFQGVGGHGAGSHQLEIFEVLMQAYTSSDGKLMGEQYANRDGTMSREDIYQPCLGVYGTSTKESFYDAMNSKLALNGFIPRWLVVEDDLPYRIGKHIEGDKSPPEVLINEFKALCEKPLMYYNEPNNNYLKTHDPDIVPFDDDARILMADFERRIVDLQNNEASKSSIPTDSFRAIWGRAWVSAVKICLVCHEGETITKAVAKWSIELVSILTDNMIADLSRYVSDNQYEANVKRFVDVIRKAPGISREQLTYKTRWLRDRNHRTDIIETLLEAGDIEVRKNEDGTNKASDRFYLLKGK